MLDIIRNNLLPCTLNIFVVVYILTKLFDNPSVFRNKKTYLMVTILIILSIINYFYIGNSVRFLISTVYITICAWIIFSIPLHKVIVAVVIEQVIMFISELIYMLIVILFLQFDNLVLFDKIQGTLITTICICIISIFLINIKLIKGLCNKILGYMDKIKQKNKYILALFFIITMNILLLIIYINSKNMILVLINAIFILVYSYVVYLLLNEKHLNVKVTEENKFLLDNLNDYEKMLDYQRVANHENKNQLLIIKTMIGKTNKKLHAYLDEIIEEKREDDEVLYASAIRIPSGGLQGLVYQKMLYSKEKNIDVNLNVSNDIRKIKLSKLDAKTNFDICRIIGVFIDNAIEETIKLEQKEISISMYKDEKNFVIDVANKCKELPNLEKMDNKGYTTKEKGHGYGLSLVKDICEKNKDIKNERKIVGDIFFQIIKIKL